MRVRITVPVLLAAVPNLRAQDDEPQYSMRYGPQLTTTVECGGRSGATLKGLVVRGGDVGTAVFDTELLRLSAAWTDGWLRLRGTAYDGAHGPMPGRCGVPLVETVPGPGWAHAGSFDDPRSIPFGPLPREWGRYLGARLVADDGVVIDYTVDDMTVREQLTWQRDRRLVRTLEFGPSAREQQMVVCDSPSGTAGEGSLQAPQRLALLQWPACAADGATVEASSSWDRLCVGAPASGDLLERGGGAHIVAVPGFAVPAGDLAALRDGDGTVGVTFGGGDEEAARLCIDLQRTVDVTQVRVFAGTGSGHGASLRGRVYGSDAAAAPDAAGKDLRAAGWRELGRIDSSGLPAKLLTGAALTRSGGFGHLRHLLFVVDVGAAPLVEIDVFGDGVAPAMSGGLPQQVLCALHGDAGPELATSSGRMLLRVPAHDAPWRVQLVLARGSTDEIDAALPAMTAARELPPLPTEPAAARWGEPLVTHGVRGADDGAFAVDTIAIPFDNPFQSRMRTGAFDFFGDGRAAVSTWNGDVWVVDGIDDDLGELHWRRFATGLYDPLGLRIVDDVVHVLGRDGITRLHDRNGDGEADQYECFNNQVCITNAFHEFAFDLQTDGEGNFYFSKGAPVKPGGRGFMPIAPHHGTILKVSKDGTRIEPIATGLRAPNGIGVSPAGVVTSGDNEGTYVPRCRINYITHPGFYGGVADTAHRTPVPAAPDLPLCWMPMEVDNSSGGQVWVTGTGWPDLAGRMLHLSYGTCSVYLVLKEEVDGQVQGGVVRLPADFSSSCMRGRFSPRDGQLYVIGLQGWQTSASREGGFHRVRRTAAPLGLPIALRTCTAGVYLTFAEPLDPATATDPDSFGVEIWNYRYSSNYGSPEVSVLHPERQVAEGKPNRDALKITSARLSDDRRTVFLAVDGMQPVQQMKVTWNVDTADGATRRGELHNTIHALIPDPGFPTGR